MTAFSLDTSGVVKMGDAWSDKPWDLEWSDLSPFQQGYVEALFAGLRSANFWPACPHARRIMRFDRLAPEALALILKDCDRHCIRSLRRIPQVDARDGANFWKWRQEGLYRDAGYVPVTPYLSDEGKVCLRETA